MIQHILVLNTKQPKATHWHCTVVLNLICACRMLCLEVAERKKKIIKNEERAEVTPMETHC